MELVPILSTLRRHKTASSLIVLEIALTCAIVCNALFLIGDRMSRMKVESGLAESELVRIQITGIGRDANPEVLTRQDLASLRNLPGVKAAANVNMVPFGDSSWNSSVGLEADQQMPTMNAGIYLGSEDLVETLGVDLVAGRDFLPEEYVDFSTVQEGGAAFTGIPAAIVTRDAADKLFGGKDAVGQVIYSWGRAPTRVVGVVDRLIRPNNQGGPNALGWSLIFPIKTPYDVGGNYLIRVDPERRQETITAAIAALEANGPNRIILDKTTLEDLRSKRFRPDRAMAWLLGGVCVALLVITALGIVGLASFWVQQRTRHIGIRRALGATRGQILRYFQLENFVLATAGIALGMILAYGMSSYLMDRYELPRLPAYFLPIGAVTLWLLGQFAVLGPALRAAAVPPAVATRTV